jgi:hypothetical protein
VVIITTTAIIGLLTVQYVSIKSSFFIPDIPSSDGNLYSFNLTVRNSQNLINVPECNKNLYNANNTNSACQ